MLLCLKLKCFNCILTLNLRLVGIYENNAWTRKIVGAKDSWSCVKGIPCFARITVENLLKIKG